MSSSQSTRVSNPSPSKQPKAHWHDDNTKVLLQQLAEQIREGNRVNGVFNAQGWRTIVNKFLNLTGLAYSKNQLKNRSSQLRSLYSKWVKITDRASGLGFDSSTGAVIAEDEWWTALAQEDPEVLKLKAGPPKFLDLMYECYADTFATGNHAYIPSYIPRVSPSVSEQVPSHSDMPHTVPVPPSSRPSSAVPDVAAGAGTSNNPLTGTVSPTNKRGRDSNPRWSSGVELSASVGEIASILKHKQAKMDAALEATDPELEDVDTAYNLLSSMPYVEEASDFHLKALNVLRDKIWRHTFVKVISKFLAEAQVKWFKSNFN